MKFSLSNLIAIASIMVWATAWAATEKKADAFPTPASFKATNHVELPKHQRLLTVHAEP